MPWKFTKLVFYGVAVRRRTLFVIALVTSIVAVPLLTWAVLTWKHPEVLKPERMIFLFSAAAAGALALNAWRHILQRNVILYWEEARYIWPVAMLALILVTWLAYYVGGQLPPPRWTKHAAELPLALSCVLAAPLLLVILWRWIRLPQAERRYNYPEATEEEQQEEATPAVAVPTASTQPGPNTPAANPPSSPSPPPA